LIFLNFDTILTFTNITKFFPEKLFDADYLFAGRLIRKVSYKEVSNKNKIGRVKMCGIGQKKHTSVFKFIFCALLTIQ